MIDRLREHFHTGATRSLDSRLQALDQAEKMIRENQEQICDALYADLRKPKMETLISEIAVCLDEIKIARKNLRRWMKPRCVRTPFTLWPSRSRIYPEPLGVALIIGPWNYPFQLAIAPLIGAIAAGCCAIIKPSELTPNTSKLISDLVRKYFSENHVTVVEGGIPETTALLNLKFDHIFFTGSTPVGKIVMQAAAKNLTSVTLELGGKSPVIVCGDADLELAARRIVWGKFYNAGQTCVAPDYLYVHKSVSDRLLEKIRENVVAQFGLEPKTSQSLSRIVNERNVQRLMGLVDTKKVFLGGSVDVGDRYFAPTILRDVSWTDSVMQEEIFGPILPVLTYENLDEVIRIINSKPKPLAGYLFSESKAKQSHFIENVSFGGGCINDVIVHLSNPHLPFGGVGESGTGSYHGEKSFATFSHFKSVIHRNGLFDISARYAPYTDGKLKFMRRIFRL